MEPDCRQDRHDATGVGVGVPAIGLQRSPFSGLSADSDHPPQFLRHAGIGGEGRHDERLDHLDRQEGEDRRDVHAAQVGHDATERRQHAITTLTGSALLALAFADGTLPADKVWSLAHLDEVWTIEHWGSDEEAEERRAKRFEDFNAAADVFLALKG